jgi:hypothetical protein
VWKNSFLLNYQTLLRQIWPQAGLPFLLLWSKVANSTITLEQTCEWAKRFVFRRPLALGNFLEPAITSANLILQTIIGPPFAWRWNRAVTGFITTAGQQDYTVFNWSATTVVNTGYVLIDSNGFSQQVTTGGTTGSSQPSWNETIGQTTTDGGVTWTNMGSFSSTNLGTTYQFGWIENASIKDSNPNTCAFEWKPLSSKIDLSLDSAAARPNSISAEFSDSNGNITFRLIPCPDKAYPVSITIQQKPSLITSLNGTWAPIPDEYSRLYNWGFLALMYLYADDARFQMANQKFIANLLSTSEGLTETEKNVVLNNWQQITGAPVVLVDNINQGRQGRINL